jgi:threonine dehydratase
LGKELKMQDNSALIGLEDILAAGEVIKHRVHRTPLVHSAYLSKKTGQQLYFKLEVFQKTGSFKPRGVLNKLHHLTPEERRKGVITISAGNHAQALAWGASQAGIAAVTVMPVTAVRSKVLATREYGAEVILAEGDLLTKCLEVQKERDLILVHPFDDPLVIAGQGTVGQEILEDMPEVGAIIVGVGGGGLISGISTAVKTQKPVVKIIGVEPAGAAGMSASLKLGKPVHLEHTDTIADGLAAPFAGDHTFAHVRERVDEVVIVSDGEIMEALRLLLERCKVLAEPAAAATLAALLFGKAHLPDETVTVCVLGGGNIDCERLRTLL